MSKILSRHHQKGFSYVEVLVAILVFSSAVLALAHTGISQIKSTQLLISRLANQQLLLTIQDRLQLNSEYIKKSQEKSIYFETRPAKTELACTYELLDSCNNNNCNAEEFAWQDRLELDCLAKEGGISYDLVFVDNNIESHLVRLIVSIWQQKQSCESTNCNLSKNELLL